MKHGFPNVYFGISLGMPVPVLMQFGSDRDFVKERVLKALQGEEIWCQLFSEPSGGTDLAGLRTRAETDGNGWKINGQKVWTSRPEGRRAGNGGVSTCRSRWSPGP